jgi:hypothetical protein
MESNIASVNVAGGVNPPKSGGEVRLSVWQ